MVEIRRKLIVRKEAWFDEPWRSDGDLLVFYHWSEAVNPANAQEVHSLAVDLRQTPEEIWKGFTSTTRNEIKRAERDGGAIEFWRNPPPEIIREFFADRARFAGERGMNGLDPVWMYDYAAQKQLMLSRARSNQGAALVWHSYYRGARWARLLHSVSLAGALTPDERKVAGRANRRLHWQDLLECRDAGLEEYDFGGWYPGRTDQKLLGINAFKEQFGGRKTIRYHSMAAVSPKGKLYIKARELLKGRRELPHFV